MAVSGIGLAADGDTDGPVFSAPPTDIVNVAGVIPLGNTSPRSGHVLPVDHMYLQYPDPDNGGADAYPVYAMAAGTIVLVQRNQREDRADPDYQIFIRHDRLVTVYYDHVHVLSPRLAAYTDGVEQGWLEPVGPDAALLFPGRSPGRRLQYPARGHRMEVGGGLPPLQAGYGQDAPRGRRLRPGRSLHPHGGMCRCGDQDPAP